MSLASANCQRVLGMKLDVWKHLIGCMSRSTTRRNITGRSRIPSRPLVFFSFQPKTCFETQVHWKETQNCTGHSSLDLHLVELLICGPIRSVICQFRIHDFISWYGRFQGWALFGWRWHSNATVQVVQDVIIWWRVVRLTRFRPSRFQLPPSRRDSALVPYPLGWTWFQCHVEINWWFDANLSVRMLL